MWRRSSSKPTISLQIYRAVAFGLKSIYTQYVYMASPVEKAAVKSQFSDFANFPGVFGPVDGTHIRIQRPYENEANYMNRHFYHSTNVQAFLST